VTHKEHVWGFPIGMETVTLILQQKASGRAAAKKSLRIGGIE